ncbi:MAG: PAS domain S-box protein [Syntrophobacteraceae bacterium]
MEDPYSDRPGILLVEDDEDDYAYICDLLSHFLSSGSTLQWVKEYDEGLGALQTGTFDVCLLDYRLGARNGIEFLEEASRSGCTTPILFLTGAGTRETDLAAMKAGAADYLAKGEMNAALLERAIRYSVERAEAKKRLHQEYEKLEVLVQKRAEELLKANTAFEQKLRDSEELFRNLFEHHTAVKLIVDPGTGKIVNANKAAEDYYGWSKEKLEQMRIYDINADSFETINREMARAKNRDRVQFEFRHRLADGSLREVEVFSSKIEVRGKQLLHSIVHDITEPKQTRAALNRERQRFKQILDKFPYGICIIDRNYQIEYINPVLMREFGEVGDRKCYDYFQGFRTPCPKCSKELVFQGKVLHWSWRSPENRRDYDLVGLPLSSETGAVSMLEVFNDVTARKQAEEDLRRRTEELQAILDTVPATIWFKDGDNNFLRVNRAVCEMMGLPAEAIEGKNARELFPGRLAEKYYRDDLEVIHSGKPLMGIEEQFANGAGELRWISTDKVPWFDAQGNPSGVLAFAVDITERKLAEEEKEKLRQQLAQSRKMESVGRLAGGVAHDYNNMLGVIIGYTEMALAGVNPDDPLHADLQEILNAAMRSADITRQLLAFARKQTISPVVLDLNETVEGMLKMLRRLIGENIDLAWFPKAGLAPVKMDPSQIDQILANLCVNARDAITGVGNVTIETDMVCFDEAYCAGHEGFFPGKFVLLAVSDSGCGMDRETLQSIFEPFFTTKEVNKGTGLGLSTVYGIVKQNGGFVNVYSESGSGTTFKIYLPCAREEISQEEGLREKQRESRGTETILLVEDEQSILKLGKTILEQHGYTVLTARDPAEALELVKSLASPINLLITDVIMPEMSGKDLHERLRRDNPHLPCIFMSGYTANVIAHNGVLDQGVNFLQKPFSVHTLTEKVRSVLDR